MPAKDGVVSGASDSTMHGARGASAGRRGGSGRSLGLAGRKRTSANPKRETEGAVAVDKQAVMGMRRRGGERRAQPGRRIDKTTFPNRNQSECSARLCFICGRMEVLRRHWRMRPTSRSSIGSGRICSRAMRMLMVSASFWTLLWAGLFPSSLPGGVSNICADASICERVCRPLQPQTFRMRGATARCASRNWKTGAYLSKL